jgi:chitin synthase
MSEWFASLSDSTWVNYNIHNNTATNTPPFIAISGLFTCMTLLEMALQIPFVLYCLIKVAIKSRSWSSRLLCISIMLLYLAFRSMFLPVFIAYLPFPADYEILLPRNWLLISVLITSLLYLLFWTMPLIILIVQWRKTKFRKENVVYDQDQAPMMMVVMPIYNEDPDTLRKAILGVVENRYPKSKLKLFLSFDDDKESPLFLSTIKFIGVAEKVNDEPHSRLLNVTFRGVQVVVCRFPHGGKRVTQSNTFQLLDTYLLGSRDFSNKEPLLMMIDSDVVLDMFAFAHLVAEFEKAENAANATAPATNSVNAKIRRSETESSTQSANMSTVSLQATEQSRVQNKRCLALTGLILCSKTESFNPLVMFQDVEYTHAQMLDRLLESTLGAVTCLPGAFTVVRYDAFRKSATQYFRSIKYDDLFDYMKYYLGEDRYLTHIFMEEFMPHQIQFCYSAFCKTEAPATFLTLLKQRRRWYLGALTNQLTLLSIPKLWKKYPFLLVVSFLNEVLRHSAIFGYVLIMHVVISWESMAFTILAILGPLFVNWFCLSIYAFHLRRYKSIALYPLLYVIQPLFGWISTLYSILTSHSHTWGGPRTVSFQASSEKKWGSQMELDSIAKKEKWVLEDDIIRMY